MFLIHHESELLSSITGLRFSGIANADVRQWFKESITGKEFVSEIYISAITRNPCITISLPIINERNEIIGVIGVDLKIESK